MSDFQHPSWRPQVAPGSRILITGASGGLGQALVQMLLEGSECIIGAHGAENRNPLNGERIIHLNRVFENEGSCSAVIEDFIAKAGGMDALVVLSGAIEFSGHWEDMAGADWNREIDINLNHPFFLARAAMGAMKKQGKAWTTNKIPSDPA